MPHFFHWSLTDWALTGIVWGIVLGIGALLFVIKRTHTRPKSNPEQAHRANEGRW